VQTQRGEVRLLISAVNRGEVLYNLAKRAGLQAALEALRTVSRYVESVAVTEEDADAAASLKFHYKLGYADCFAAELAQRRAATLVTADPEFAKLGNKLKILALPRHGL
jgi:predicted nucleic acid-binding protein